MKRFFIVLIATVLSLSVNAQPRLEHRDGSTARCISSAISMVTRHTKVAMFASP